MLLNLVYFLGQIGIHTIYTGVTCAYDIYAYYKKREEQRELEREKEQRELEAEVWLIVET